MPSLCEIWKFSSISRFEHESQKKPRRCRCLALIHASIHRFLVSPTALLIGLNKNLLWIFNLLLWWDVAIAISLEVPRYRTRRKQMGGDTSTKFLCGLHPFLLVHWLNLRFLIVHSSSSNMFFFLIARRLFKDLGEKVNLSATLKYVLLVHRNLLHCSWCHFEILLKSVMCDTE